VLEILSVPLLGIIPESEAVLRASNLGTPVTICSGDSPPARAYTAAARRLAGENIEMSGLSVNRGQVMPGVDAAGTLAVPIWLAGAAAAPFVGSILLAAKRAGGVALITSLFRVGVIAAVVLGAWLYAQQRDVIERRALDDRKTALMAGFEEQVKKFTAIWSAPRPAEGVAAAAGPSVVLPGTNGRGTVASLPRDPAAPEPVLQSAAVTPPAALGSVTSPPHEPRPPPAAAEPVLQSAAVTPPAAPGSVTSPPHEPPPPPAAAERVLQSAAVTPPAALGSVISLPQEQPPLRDPAAGTVSQESSLEATSHGAGPPQFGSPQGDAAASLSGPSHETLSTTAPDVSGTPVASPAPVDEVKAYLWSVYQRSPTKADGHGDFTWKDVSAAGHAGLSVEDYVIGGIDPDFRELLFAAGHAMDAAGVEWTILSAFRDDFRQNLAAGLKARVNNSFHGGSEATGGYGHGCAVDLASVDRLSDDKVWNWVDRKGREFDLNRPLRAADPAHTLPMAGWHEVAAMLRNKRLGTSAEADPAPLGNLVTLEQYLCIRPLPPENAAAGAQVADSGRHTTANWAATHVSRHDTKGNGAPRKPNSVRDNETKQSAATVRAASKR
jgi:hypothetical protein